MDTINLIYDAENRLVEVKKNSVTIAQFTFDGDGWRVKSIVNGTTTYFVGAHYEMTGSQVTKYYTSACSVQTLLVQLALPCGDKRRARNEKSIINPRGVA